MVNLSTIDYDQPIENLIAGLNDTGHITHSRWKKTSVTFHHNGGRLSHQGVLNVWKTRPASAHFDVDSAGRVAQYANAFEYAWACGNTLGNQRSISIEMCNATLSPGWDVAEVTWKSAARLAAWLFANIIGEAPAASNVLFHHDWLATACAGPYMDRMRGDLIAEVQAQYRAFKGGKPRPAPHPVTPPAPTPSPVTPHTVTVEWTAGPKVGKALQDHFKSAGVHDGYFDNQDAGNKKFFPNVTCVRWVAPGRAKSSPGVQAIQRGVGVKADGLLGPNTNKALQKWAGVTQDGYLGSKSVEAICNKLGIK